MTKKASAVCALTGAMLFGSAALTAEELAPELPVAEWSEGRPTLEDFKGQPVVLVFFDDSSG